MLDDVNVSTSSLLAFVETSNILHKLYLANRSPIVSDASLTRILLAGANHALTHIWLTNTLTTEMAPEMLIASSLKEIDTNREVDDLIAHPQGEGRVGQELPGDLLEELFVSDFSRHDAVSLSRAWPKVRVVMPEEVFGVRDMDQGGTYSIARAGL